MDEEIMNNSSESKIEEKTLVFQTAHCHQCHQLRSDVVGTCATKWRNTTCQKKFCRSCLWNRYKEIPENVAFKEGWLCYRCRGICNCGYCLKNKQGKKKDKSQLEEEVKLPHGIESIAVFGIDLPSENVGGVLQFLEFCSKFGKAIGLRGGEPELVVSEIVSGRNTRSQEHSALTRMIIQLLTLILVDTGAESVGLSASDDRWFKVLGDCLAESEVKLDDFPPEMFQKGIAEYEKMGTSQRLKLLNFLCDETLSTTVLRDCFAESVEKKKETKEKLDAAKAKEQQLNQKIEDEFSKALAENNGAGAELTIKQRLAIVSQMEDESELVFAGMQNALKMQKVQEYDDVLRTSPVVMDDNGLTLWKLKSYNKEPNILLQDVGSWSDVCPHERWFAFSPEQKPQVEKYIARKKVKEFVSAF
ncbi:Uncharacterized protein HA466_0099120 [Hirschfeldia incana]|nr:Uncharacterized protein HA466_0099120 [Hirschfeldia incana]